MKKSEFIKFIKENEEKSVPKMLKFLTDPKSLDITDKAINKLKDVKRAVDDIGLDEDIEENDTTEEKLTVEEAKAKIPIFNLIAEAENPRIKKSELLEVVFKA